MQRPATPSINIDDTTQSQSHTQSSPRNQNQPQASPQSNQRPRSTASAENPDDAPWRSPSIRIRRLPSNQTVQRARAVSVASAGRNAEYRGVRHLSVAAGPGAAPPTPGSDGYLTVEAPSSSTTRPRSGSGSNRPLRHENRSLAVPVPDKDGGRKRSSSDPSQMNWEALPGMRGSQRDSSRMPPLEEDTATTSTPPQRPANLVLPPGNGNNNLGEVDRNPDPAGYFGIGRRLSNAAGQTYSRFFPTLNTVNTEPQDPREEQYESHMVDVLDTLGENSYLRGQRATTDLMQIQKFRRSIPLRMSRIRCSCPTWEDISIEGRPIL